MTISERIRSLVNSQWNFTPEDQPADIEKMLVMAYYMGREDAAKEVSDMYSSHIKKQHERAASCRYHHLAAEVVGPEEFLYFPDYAGEMTRTFGQDLADI